MRNLKSDGLSFESLFSRFISDEEFITGLCPLREILSAPGGEKATADGLSGCAAGLDQFINRRVVEALVCRDGFVRDFAAARIDAVLQMRVPPDRLDRSAIS